MFFNDYALGAEQAPPHPYLKMCGGESQREGGFFREYKNNKFTVYGSEGAHGGQRVVKRRKIYLEKKIVKE